jgi:hypothetical protein
MQILVWEFGGIFFEGFFVVCTFLSTFYLLKPRTQNLKKSEESKTHNELTFKVQSIQRDRPTT